MGSGILYAVFLYELFYLFLLSFRSFILSRQKPLPRFVAGEYCTQIASGKQVFQEQFCAI